MLLVPPPKVLSAIQFDYYLRISVILKYDIINAKWRKKGRGTKYLWKKSIQAFLNRYLNVFEYIKEPALCFNDTFTNVEY